MATYTTRFQPDDAFIWATPYGTVSGKVTEITIRTDGIWVLLEDIDYGWSTRVREDDDHLYTPVDYGQMILTETTITPMDPWHNAGEHDCPPDCTIYGHRNPLD